MGPAVVSAITLSSDLLVRFSPSWCRHVGRSPNDFILRFARLNMGWFAHNIDLWRHHDWRDVRLDGTIDAARVHWLGIIRW